MYETENDISKERRTQLDALMNQRLASEICNAEKARMERPGHGRRGRGGGRGRGASGGGGGGGISGLACGHVFEPATKPSVFGLCETAVPVKLGLQTLDSANLVK